MGNYYIFPIDGQLVMQCRCLICSRCGQHTGNNTQGHWWGYCAVTKTGRQGHFCCPNDCELEAKDYCPDGWRNKHCPCTEDGYACCFCDAMADRICPI